MRNQRTRSRALKRGAVGGVSSRRNRRASHEKGNGRARRRPAETRKTADTRSARTLFPEVAAKNSRFGMGILLAVMERQGSHAELGYARVGRFHPKPGRQPKAAILGAVDAGKVARMLAGLAHPDRIRILRAILQGSATHFALRKAVGLKTGPLYHHLRALERAGVLTMATRNAYELTERGRVVLLVTNTLGVVFAGNGRSWTKQRMNWERN